MGNLVVERLHPQTVRKTFSQAFDGIIGVSGALNQVLQKIRIRTRTSSVPPLQATFLRPPPGSLSGRRHFEGPKREFATETREGLY